MHSCDDIRELMLESLYGLLEPAAEEELRAHVAGCAGCQAHLVEARRQQTLLAQAARMVSDAAPFTAPDETIAPLPVSLPAQPAAAANTPAGAAVEAKPGRAGRLSARLAAADASL